MPPRPPPAPATLEARAQEEEIFLRLPPDDPGSLFRASLVCKAWRSLLTCPDFARHYRKFHRTPPLLGFFENHDTVRVWFEPSTPTSPFLPMHPDHRDLFVLDSRHGLVLLRTPVAYANRGLMAATQPAERLIVWDPVGRRQWEFPPPEFANTIIYDNAVVLCAADGCDHLGCHGDRFLVAYVGGNHLVVHASVFSSETRAWSHVASYYPPELNLNLAGSQLKALVGNALYFTCMLCSTILRFDYIRLELSVIHGPSNNHVLMKTEEGMLGGASMEESGLCLWSMETVPDGSVAWKKGKFIELDMLLACNSSVIGFAEGIGVFYLGTACGIFTVELKSGGVKNILPVRNFRAIPYMSFYTPDQAKAITLPSTMASSLENVKAAQEHYGPLQMHSIGQVGDAEGKREEGGGWEEVGDGEKEGGQQEEKAAQDLFSKGSKAFEDLDFVSAADCLRRSLGIRVAHHGKLSPKCRDTYYRYGWALVRRARTCNGLHAHEHSMRDLDLAWRMLHVARVILEKSRGSTRQKVKILAALAKVSMQRENIRYSSNACFKALDILTSSIEPYYLHIMSLNIQMTYEFPKNGDAKAISLWKARIQNLKRANEVLLADKGDEASATEVGLEESSLPKDIKFVANILLSALEKKLEDLERAISIPVSEASGEAYVGNDVPGAVSSTTSSQFSGSSNTMSTAETIGTTGNTETDLEAAGRGIKRANVEQISSEPSPKKFAESSSSVKVDSSHSSDCHLAAPDSDDSVSE